jgi:lipopolysaccharide export system permease protein
MLIVAAVVLSLDLLFAFMGELEDLNEYYKVTDALIFVVYTLPRRVYDYLPLVAFMGCLIGLGAMAKNSELVIIRAAGVSTRKIVLMAMKPAVIVVVLGLLLGEYVAPVTEKIAQNQRAVALGAEQKQAVTTGVWHREGNSFMRFNAAQSKGVLHGVYIHEFDDERKLLTTLFAKRAVFKGSHWELEEVVETGFSDSRTKVSNYGTKIWYSDLSPEVLHVLVISPDDLSISELSTYSKYLDERGLNSDAYMMSFWKKVLQPLSTAVLVLVAISFVFGPLRSVTVGFRVFTGVIVGLVFKFAQDLLGPSTIVFGFNPIFATIIPISVCLVIGFAMLSRAR